MRAEEIRSQAGRFLRPVVDAFWRGTADPPDKADWPVSLRPKWPFRRVTPTLASIGFNVVLALIILGTTSSFLSTKLPTYHPNTLLLTSAALACPLLLRHWHPLGAWRISLLGVVWTASKGWEGPQYLPGGVIVFLLCSFSVARRCDRQITIGAGILTVGAVWAIDPKSAFVAAMVALVPLLAGYNVRTRQAGRRELAQREEVHREERAVLAERQRIAREMHDVVAHHMSVIAIQAEAAPYRVPDPDPVLAKSFADIRGNALAGLADLRRILGVLRDENTGLLTAPQPDLDRIGELVGNARGTGARVTADITAPPDELPPAVGLAAYRIVQEALSNALKHASGADVHIAVRPAPGPGDTGTDTALLVEVVNGPPPPRPEAAGDPVPAAGAGHGVIGMRERAVSLGGTFDASSRPGGGFAVTASLPLPERP